MAEKSWSKSCFKQLEHGKDLGSDRLDLNVSTNPVPKEGTTKDTSRDPYYNYYIVSFLSFNLLIVLLFLPLYKSLRGSYY